ncbi:hypothetical protein D3C76_1195840 [compost metagenome]
MITATKVFFIQNKDFTGFNACRQYGFILVINWGDFAEVARQTVTGFIDNGNFFRCQFCEFALLVFCRFNLFRCVRCGTHRHRTAFSLFPTRRGDVRQALHQFVMQCVRLRSATTSGFLALAFTLCFSLVSIVITVRDVQCLTQTIAAEIGIRRAYTLTVVKALVFFDVGGQCK